MPFKVQVGPPQIAIHQAQTVLITENDGGITWPTDKGLYFRDTRLISAWSIYANGVPWRLLNGGAITYYAARVFLTNDAFRTQDGMVDARTVALVISREIDGGMHEDLDITNHGAAPLKFNLELALRCDFADTFEVKSDRIVRRGKITTVWDEAAQKLSNTYCNADFIRAVTITALHAPALYANGRLSFDIELAPGASWHCCLRYDLTDGEVLIEAPRECAAHDAENRHSANLRDWQSRVLKITSSNEEYYRFFHQAVEDMAALRLPIGSGDHMEFVPAAGLPWFMAPFGRDSLIVSLQNITIYPEFARGALDVLGSLQATEYDAYRDAEPGKIMHELRYGELAHFKLIPHTPYYGTADATPLWLITLHAAWRATGDRDLLDRHLKTAEACLEWIDHDGDRDGDGFQEYQTRSSAGYENMGWKDSGEAVMYPDGTLVRGPKALCELQGYVYDAWQRMAQIFDVLGQAGRASDLRNKAHALFERFNAAFWDEAGGYYAYALDGEKKQVLSVASNPGHCLWSGIVRPDRAQKVVQRLMAPDMWSGFGIRTLSSAHKSFNPYAYQLGAVWPHDNSLIALGFKRYGFDAEAAQIARDISGAASHFENNQLPELYAGIQKDSTNFPVQYLGANVPQAWAAGSAFTLLHAMLGLAPDAPQSRLTVDPALPDWMPDVTLTDLTVGQTKFAIRFWRDGAATRHEVLAGDPAAVQRLPFGRALDFGVPGEQPGGGLT
ncbi:glycogen debranching N-terminal domain-containing protein [Lichenicola sp.]|uniref:amylo-alpha-1,6-glucosidase n=1 Tax=Lichenicola sp. TaxID=2804529 RepID=UPI003B00ACD0